MAFPQINFKFNDLEEAQALSELVEQKMVTLEKYIAEHSSGNCDFEFSKIAAQQNGQVHRVEATLRVDGTTYRAGATEESFEKAIDEVKSELDKEMRRAKDKQDTLKKQSGRQAKEDMLNGA
jgi:ribosomal subunit interface protein